MEKLTIACPECGHDLHLPDRSLLGRAARCPGCNHKFLLQERMETAPDGDSLSGCDTLDAGVLVRSVPELGDWHSEVPRQFGRYELLRQLGEGAMGTVFLARDTKLARQVALKIPKFSELDDPELLPRFYREARSAATLRHPNICPVYDVGEINGAQYFTMAYIEGETLASLVSRENPPPPQQIATILRKLASALEHAHKQRVVHRDLKPTNVMLDKRGDPVVMDFGLARQLKTGDVRLTQTGVLIGTPAYMSPEHVQADWEQVGPRTDIYSLGVILYELLTGEIPFTGAIGTIIGQILTKPPTPPSELQPNVNPSLEAICLKMMQKDMDDRYQSMGEVVKDVTRYLMGERIEIPDPPKQENKSAETSAVDTRAVAATLVEGLAPPPMEPAKPSTPKPAPQNVPPPQPAAPVQPIVGKQPGSTLRWLQIVGGVAAVALLAYLAVIFIQRDGDSHDSSPNGKTLSIAGISKRSIVPGEELTIRVQLEDSANGSTPNDVVFRLGSSAPSGCRIDPKTGVIRWTPSSDVAPGEHRFTVIVSRTGDASVLGERQVSVSVGGRNQAPVIHAIEDQTVDEETELSFRVHAADPDQPEQPLRLWLAEGAPEGAAIDGETGMFNWKPGEADGPGEIEITVHAADSGDPPGETSQQFKVTIREVNRQPLILPTEEIHAEAGIEQSVDVKAIDPDFPNGTLTFALADDAPPGSSIDARTGRLTWTPPPELAGKTVRVGVTVSDDGESPLTARTEIAFAVAEPEPTPAFSCSNSADEDRKFAGYIRRMIEEGWKDSRTSAAAKADFSRAEQICERDPRLYYAAGLLELKHLNYDEAQTQIERAAKTSEYPYLAAWKTLIRRKLVRKDYAAALVELEQLAKALEGESPYLGRGARNETAGWMGRLIGYLSGPANLSKLQTDVTLYDRKMGGILTGSRLKSYETGKTDSVDLFASLSGVRSRQVETAEEDLEKKKQELAAQSSELEDEKTKLKESADRTRAQAEKLIADYDGQLTSLETSFNQLTTQMQIAANAISQLQSQISAYNTEYQRALQNNDNNTANRYLNLINQSRQSLTVAQQQHQALTVQQNLVYQQANSVLQKRQIVVAQYQKQTGNLLEQSSTLDKWSKRLKSREKALEDPRQTRTGKVAATDRKLHSLDTYVPFDLESEKLKLLSALSESP